jgi:hypothetical protein
MSGRALPKRVGECRVRALHHQSKGYPGLWRVGDLNDLRGVL